MTPDYFLCDKCKTEKVEMNHRLCFADVYDDLGKSQTLIVDLCPDCMASYARSFGGAGSYHTWEGIA